MDLRHNTTPVPLFIVYVLLHNPDCSLIEQENLLHSYKYRSVEAECLVSLVDLEVECSQYWVGQVEESLIRTGRGPIRRAYNVEPTS